MAVNSLQAEQDSVMGLSVLLAQLLVHADRSLIGRSYKEINKNKSPIPFETSSNNSICLAAKVRHGNSRTTEKGCAVLVPEFPGC